MEKSDEETKGRADLSRTLDGGYRTHDLVLANRETHHRPHWLDFDQLGLDRSCRSSFLSLKA